MAHGERVVVIGGVAGGMSAAARAKRVNPHLDVVVLERSPYVSYGACGLPYFIAGLIPDHRRLIVYTPEYLRQERGIDVRTNAEVIQIRPAERAVIARDSQSGREEKIGYDYLVIATGARPIRPSLPGMELDNVFVLRSLEHGIHLQRAIAEMSPRRAVIIGAGYIGLEMAEALRLRGLDVTVVEALDHVLGHLEPDISRLVEEELAAKGAHLLKMTKVTALEGDARGRVRRVLTDRGEQIDAELVLVGIGIRPAVALAEEAGIALGPTGAIAVNERQETNIARIYAAGDCCEARHIVTGQPTWIPLGPAANKQGRVVGDNVAGRRARFAGVVGTAVTKVFDLAVARTGLSVDQAKRAGFKPGAAAITASSRAGYYPGGQPITVKVIFDRESQRLLGAQMVGREGVAKRIDIFATALHADMTLSEMAGLDLSYAPPFAPVWDPVLIAVNAALKQR
ncbi:MAG: NADH oxidase [Acidobacteria bacterium]|nr:MAG: NADH oxidase [Acidobacteriota bacterium]